MSLLACWNGRIIQTRLGFEFSGVAWASGYFTSTVMRAGLGVESHCCHVSFVLSLHNATRELVSVSSGFRASEVTAFRLGLATFACALQSLDCVMRLEIQQLNTGMAVLQGITCCFCN